MCFFKGTQSSNTSPEGSHLDESRKGDILTAWTQLISEVQSGIPEQPRRELYDSLLKANKAFKKLADDKQKDRRKKGKR